MVSHLVSVSSLKAKNFNRLRPEARTDKPSTKSTPRQRDDDSLKSDAYSDPPPVIKIGTVSRFFKNVPTPKEKISPTGTPVPERPSSPPWDIDWVVEGLSSPSDDNNVENVGSSTMRDNFPVSVPVQSRGRPSKHEQIRAQIDSPEQILPNAAEMGVDEDLSIREVDIFEVQANDQHFPSLISPLPSQQLFTPLHAHPVLPESKLLDPSINTLSELGTYPYESHNSLYRQSPSQVQFSNDPARHPISYTYLEYESVADAPDYAASAIPEVVYMSDGDDLSGFGDVAPFAELPAPQDPHSSTLQFRGGSDDYYAIPSAPPPREDRATIYLTDEYDHSGEHSMDLSDALLSTDEPFPDTPDGQLSDQPNEHRHYFIEGSVQEMRYSTYPRSDHSSGDVEQRSLTDTFPADQANGDPAVSNQLSAICEVEACLGCGGAGGSEADGSDDFSLGGVPRDNTRVFDAHPSHFSFFPDECFSDLEARRQLYSVPGPALRSSSSENDDHAANSQKPDNDMEDRMSTFHEALDRPLTNQLTPREYRNNGKISSSYQQYSREDVSSPSSSSHPHAPRQRFQQGRALLLGLNDMGPALINNSGSFPTGCIESSRIQDHVARTLERNGYWNRSGAGRHT